MGRVVSGANKEGEGKGKWKNEITFLVHCYQLFKKIN